MNLSEWVDKIKKMHGQEIELRLERTTQVAEKLGILENLPTVITVAGTNGKGSSVAGIEAILSASGYKVGAFTTPFICRYNEQVRIQGEVVSDLTLCEAFAEVEKACGSVTLTPFEFGALAALIIFKKADLDVWILEVGMGGRWDAVNVIAADVAVIASIDLDHMEWLGTTREAIGYEKAGIFRPLQLAVYGDFDPPASVVEYAESLKTSLWLQGKQFSFVEKADSWSWVCGETELDDLPLPSLALQNMSTVLMVIELLQPTLPVKREAIEFGLSNVRLPGRIQVMQGEITRILDVSHNPASVGLLKKYLQKNRCEGKTYAVFSMLVDKDILETVRVIESEVDGWYVAPVKNDRKASNEVMRECFRKLGVENVVYCESIVEAQGLAMEKARMSLLQDDVMKRDRVVIFGSFRTVAEVMEQTDAN